MVPTFCAEVYFSRGTLPQKKATAKVGSSTGGPRATFSAPCCGPLDKARDLLTTAWVCVSKYRRTPPQKEKAFPFGFLFSSQPKGGSPERKEKNVSPPYLQLLLEVPSQSLLTICALRNLPTDPGIPRGMLTYAPNPQRSLFRSEPRMFV